MLSLSVLIGCIILLVLAITYFDIHPVIALLLVGLLLGSLLGLDIETTTNSLLSGFGNTLKWIGLIILFGTLLGEILALTGGATLIAEAIIALFGQKYLVLGVALIGFLVGIPVFVDVAYLTLLPTLIALAKKTGQSILVLGLALALSLGVAHALIPPTPGPLAVAAMLNTEVGNIIPLNTVAAITAILIGVTFILLFRGKLQHPVIKENPNDEITTNNIKGYKRALPFLALISPLTLMGVGTFLSDDFQIIAFIKSPLWALLIGILFTLPLIPRPNRLKQVNSQLSLAMKKSAAVILITGCGGAFGQVIKDTNIISQLINDPNDVTGIGILLALALSFTFTTITGSITVSLITTASIMAPIVSEGALSPEITAAAIGAGSLGIIHVNSSFFWLFKETHQLTAKKVLRSFSLATLTMALGSGSVIYLISKIF